MRTQKRCPPRGQGHKDKDPKPAIDKTLGEGQAPSSLYNSRWWTTKSVGGGLHIYPAVIRIFPFPPYFLYVAIGPILAWTESYIIWTCKESHIRLLICLYIFVTLKEIAWVQQTKHLKTNFGLKCILHIGSMYKYMIYYLPLNLLTCLYIFVTLNEIAWVQQTKH